MPETLTREESPNRLVNIRLLYEECGEFFETLSTTEKYGAAAMMGFLYQKATGERPPADAFQSKSEQNFARRLR